VWAKNKSGQEGRAVTVVALESGVSVSCPEEKCVLHEHVRPGSKSRNICPVSPYCLNYSTNSKSVVSLHPIPLLHLIDFEPVESRL
jgi:hypothetical protein